MAHNNKTMNNEKLFRNKFGEFYIPDNAEDESDWYSWEHFRDVCTEAWSSHEETFVDMGLADVDQLTNYCITSIDWQFLETLIDEMLMLFSLGIIY